MAFCGTCGLEIVVREQRRFARSEAYLKSDAARLRSSYPIGAVSLCPIHGFGFPIRVGA